MSEKITIVLPDGRQIKRVMYGRYVANFSLCWVICGGVKFYIDYYDLNNTSNGLYRLDYCHKDEFLKIWTRIFYTDRPKVDKEHEHIIGVEGSSHDHEYNNIVVTNFIKVIR